MPKISINSGTITTFGFSANIDIYARSITFNLLPFTVGPNLANRPVCFSVVDQDGVILSSINFTSPQIPNAGTTTSWVLDLSSVNYAFLFQAYAIYAAIQDVGGRIYQTNVIYPNICQPNDLTDSGYVPGCFQIIPDCVNNVLTLKEITALVYNGLQPTTVTKSGVLNYPTGTGINIAFSNTPFSNNVVFTGTYTINNTTVATYAIGNDIYVLVSYIVVNSNFPVTCANKMADILCCITKIQQTAIRNCDNAIGANAKQQLVDISMFVMSGFMKEVSGQDASFEVEYIKKYLSCDCGSSSLTQSEFTPINPAVTSIVLNGVGGTSIPSPTTTGNTQTYNIASNVYQIVKGNTGDLAFTIALNTAISNTVQYIIIFNYDTMAGYILTAIQNDPTLLAQLNSLIAASGSILGLNGSCIINTSQITYSLSQAVTGATIITNIVINGTNYAAPTNLFANNPTAVAAWLNSLTLGIFSATLTTGVLTILSTNNTNIISTMTFTGPNVVQQFQTTNVTLVQVLQAIINYLCNLTSLQIALGSALSVCTLDYNNNIVSTNYPSNTSQNSFNSALANAVCNICARINTLSALTCTKLQAIFSANPNAVFNNSTDWYMSVVGGTCTQLTGRQAALGIIAAINSYSDVKTAYCAISCTSPATCPDVSGINLSIVGTNIGIYGVTWSIIPIANQTVSVFYRIHGTTSWITSTNNLSLFPNGNINGTSPYPISGLTAGTNYDVWIQNNCGGVGFVTQITTPTGSVYEGSYLLGNVLYSICVNSPTNLYSSSPFATGVTMYSNVGLTVPVTGYIYIVPIAGGNIYNINTGTGVVGSNTGSSCSSGTPGSYILGNSTGTICSGSSVTRYTNGAFSVGGILYVDSALTTPVTGSSYVVNNSTGIIYNLNSVTGAIGASTGLTCALNTVQVNDNSANFQLNSIVGISSFTPSPALPITNGQNTSGSHSAFTGIITIGFVIGGSGLNTNIDLSVNGVVLESYNWSDSVTGSQNFNSRTYNLTDYILINIYNV